MRTTLDIPDHLLRKAKQTALRKKTTLRSIVIQALDKEIQNEEESVYIPKMITAGDKADSRMTSETLNALISEDNDHYINHGSSRY